MNQASPGAAQLIRQAAAALQQQRPDQARSLLEQAVALAPEQIEAQLNLALACRLLGDRAAAIAAFDAVLAREPTQFVALLSKAALVSETSGPRAAVPLYKSALRHAPDAARLPPPLAAALQQARDAVQADAAALRDHLQQHTATLRQELDPATRDRFDESVDVFAGTAAPVVRRPLLLHYARLPAIPFYDRSLFPWLDELEAATGMIAAELRGVLADTPEGFTPYVQYPRTTAPGQFAELNHSRRWSSYFLWKNGIRQDEPCRRCPGTAALIDRLPLMHQRGFAPTAVFSALEPHTTIPPHTGSTSTRLLCHLPLILPGPARFRVGPHTREWRLGEAWVFDDTIEHEAWNDADELRVILILDVWNPFLGQAERHAIDAMMAARAAYYAG